MSLAYLTKYLNKTEDTTSRKRKAKAAVVIDETELSNQLSTDAKRLQQDTDLTYSATKRARFRPAYENLSGDGKRNEATASAKSSGHGVDVSSKADAALEVHQQTVYRDATGRRVDVTLARQEKARELQLEHDRKTKQKLLSGGLVQQEQKEESLRNADRLKNEGFSRYADHQDLEAMQQSRIHWNDPAAAFLAKEAETPERSRMPEYRGTFAVNRFGIKPGYVSHDLQCN